MRITPSGRECFFGEEEIIVSKTDTQGRIRYANDVFLRVAGYTEAEILGQPHSIIRHPDMPRCVFKLLWDTIQSGEEVFAYVMNMAKNGDHYWVFAHVTPSFGADGAIVGYHSSRRHPDAAALDAIKPMYAELLAAERARASKNEQIAAGAALLGNLVGARKTTYAQLMFTL